MISCSRFESGIGLPESTMQLVFGNLSFTDAAIAQGIREDQVLVEGRVTQSGDRGSPIQRRKPDAALLALIVRPDWSRLVPLANDAAQRFSGVRCRNTTRDLHAPEGKHT